MRTILKKALITEKSYKHQDLQTYSFLVEKDANKSEVAQAIEQLFGVKVGKVNMITVRPKLRPLKGSRVHTRRAAKKKALVTLVDRAKLDLTKLKK